jgi:hypothetical protein
MIQNSTGESPSEGFANALGSVPPILVIHEPATKDEPTPPIAESPAEIPSATPRAQRKSVPGWAIPAAIAAVCVIVAGALGGLLYVNTGQRDLARHQLAATTSTLTATKGALEATQGQLNTAETQLAIDSVAMKYETVTLADHGRVQADYDNLYIGCASTSQGSTCRGAMQQLATDLVTYSSDHQSLSIPATAADADANLKDALRAAVAAAQEQVAAFDDTNVARWKAAISTVQGAMLNLAKAQAAVGTALR